MSEANQEPSEVAVVVDALIATSTSRSEKRSLVKLKKSLSPSVNWGDPTLQGDSQGHGLLTLANALSKHPSSLERFVEMRRNESVSAREWRRLWITPVLGTATLLIALTSMAVGIEVLGAMSGMREIGLQVEQLFSFFSAIQSNQSHESGLVALIDRFGGVMRSLFVGVVPGLVVLFGGKVLVNYWIAGAKAVDVAIYRIPIFGRRRMQTDGVRLLSGTAMLMNAGEPLPKAVTLCGNSMSPFPKYLSEKIGKAIASGVPWSQAIANERLFPDWAIEWFAQDVDSPPLPTRLEAAAELIAAESSCSAGIGSRFLVVISLWCVAILTLWFYVIFLWAIVNTIVLLSN